MNKALITAALKAFPGSRTIKALCDALEKADRERNELAADSARLLPKAASELSNAWLLHRTMMGAQAALFCINNDNLSQARGWLEGTTDEAPLEIPEGMYVNGLQRWFDENMVGHLTHAQALEIVKSEFPVTERHLRGVSQ
ncbi:TPA: hypothetical protein KNH08_002082 [Serratia fonticola]|nr:hypothetical protein [Serratia fonticola]